MDANSKNITLVCQTMLKKHASSFLKETYMDYKQFLKDFAEKFGKEDQKERIVNSTAFSIDYLDGVFDIFNGEKFKKWCILNDSCRDICVNIRNSAYGEYSEEKRKVLEDFITKASDQYSGSIAFHGGGNLMGDGMLYRDDYRYFWDNLVAEQKEFMQWMKDHNFTERDMMKLDGEFWPNGMIVLKPEFYFYNSEELIDVDKNEEDCLVAKASTEE